MSTGRDGRESRMTLSSAFGSVTEEDGGESRRMCLTVSVGSLGGRSKAGGGHG